MVYDIFQVGVTGEEEKFSFKFFKEIVNGQEKSAMVTFFQYSNTSKSGILVDKFSSTTIFINISVNNTVLLLEYYRVAMFVKKL